MKDGSLEALLRRAGDEGRSLQAIGQTPVGNAVTQWALLVDAEAPPRRRLLVGVECDAAIVAAVLKSLDVQAAKGFAVVAMPSPETAVQSLTAVIEHLGGRFASSRVRTGRLEPGSTVAFWGRRTAAGNAPGVTAPPPPVAPAPVTPAAPARGRPPADGRMLPVQHRNLAGALSTAFGTHAEVFRTSQAAHEGSVATHRSDHTAARQRVDAAVSQLLGVKNQAEQFLRNRSRGYVWGEANRFFKPFDLADEVDGSAQELLEDCRVAADLSLSVLRSSMMGRRKQTEALLGYVCAGEVYAQRWRDGLDQALDQTLAYAEQVLLEQQAAATERLDRELVRIGVELSAFERDLATISPAWEGADWEQWGAGGSLPYAVRFGRVVYFHRDRSATLPAILGLPGGRPLVNVFGERRAEAIASLQSIVFRLIASFPPGKVQFTFIDPVGLGQTVAPFLHLADYDEKLVGGKVWSEPKDIEAQLSDITSHIELVIQKYLRSQFASIEEHNEQAGEVSEAYRFLVVADFPVNFSDTAAKRLVSIAENGPRCGVYPLVLVDPAKPLPYGFDLNELVRSSTVVRAGTRGFVWQEEHLDQGLLELKAPPTLTVGREEAITTLFRRVVEGVGMASRQSAAVEVSPERLFDMLAKARRGGVQIDIPESTADIDLTDPRTWWTGSTARGLAAPIGRSGATKVQCLALGAGVAQHVLVVGKTGSGKSTLLHSLVTNLAVIYPPDELEVYLVDLKQGVEFKCYADLQLPHARVVAINSEREFALSVLRGLDDEMRRRGELFRASGVEDLAGHRVAGRGKKLPRVILVVDEFHEIFSEEDQIGAEAANMLDRLLRQGRAFGVHAVLGSQTLAGLRGTVTRSMSQIAVRIALQCSADDSRLILAEDNPAARLLGRPGEAIYNAANGRPDANERFQVVWLPDNQRDQLLQGVKRRSVAAAQGRRAPMVFEGNAPADLTTNPELVALLQGRSAPTPEVRVWLGEPVAIADPATARFSRRSASNLIVLGREPVAVQSLMGSTVLALAAHREVVSVDVVDFTPFESGFSEVMANLSRSLPTIRAYRRRQLPDVLADLAADVQRRLDGGGATRRFLVLQGLGQARDLSTESYEDDATRLHDQLSAILRDGPECGVHTVAWCDSFANLDRRLRNPLREFAMRVGFAMGRDESVRLLESQAGTTLKENQACLYDDDRSTSEKFRAYGRFDLGWAVKQIGLRHG